MFLKNLETQLKKLWICPSHYLSAAAWDAILSMTKVELEFISNVDIYLFFEKYMRGEVSSICKIYSKANNKYLKSYDLKQESNHIIYLDANNLYGYVMSKFLPTGRFKWIDPNLNKHNDNSVKGCVLEVDLAFSKKLHELHNDYPLAPDKIEINREILSKYQLLLIFITFLLAMVKKLTPNFFDQEKFVLHYENLQNNKSKEKNTFCIRM